MAVYNNSISTDILNETDIKKVTAYLYKLNEQLQYMFNNLDPDDNYSRGALNALVSENDRLAELSVSVDGIFANYLKGDSLVASIAMDDSGIRITADKVIMEGLITANGNFKILMDGSIEALNAKFTGSITGSEIRTSQIFGGDGLFHVDDSEVFIGGFKAYKSGKSGAMYLAFDDESVGMGNHNDYCFWAGSSGDEPPFRVNYNGELYAEEIHMGDSWWDGWTLTKTIKNMWDRLDNLEDRVNGGD